MKKYVTNGARIKQLRERLHSGGKQASFAASVGISERLLRDVENKDARLSLDKIQLIATKLGVRRYELMVPDFDSETVPSNQSSSSDEHPTRETTPPAPSPPPRPSAFERNRVYPRFEDTSLSVRDALELFEYAKGSKRVIAHIKTKLTSETEEYASELIQQLKELTWDARGVSEIPGEVALAIQRRLRELIVLLKGNDVWIYAEGMIKYTPESYEVMPSDARMMEFELVVGFGPPAQYGETSISVRYDNGQPRAVNWDKM